MGIRNPSRCTRRTLTRERVTIKSWCLRIRDSATMERTPPGPSKRARVTRKWIKRITQLSPRTFGTFARELPSLACPDRVRAADARFLRAMLSGSDPRADDQSHDHRPSSETLRPPAARTRPTHRGPDHRHRSRRSSVDDAGVAPHRANRGGQSGRGGPDRAGTPTRGPHTATTRPETRGAAPARTGPGPRLWLHVVRRATARCSRQAADPACHRSGPRMHPVAGTPAAPQSIAQSVPRVATAAHRVCTRRSVALSAHVTASTDAIGDPGDRGHGDVARLPSRSHRHTRGSGPAARHHLGFRLNLVPPRAEIWLATAPAPSAPRETQGGASNYSTRRDVAYRHHGHSSAGRDPRLPARRHRQLLATDLGMARRRDVRARE